MGVCVVVHQVEATVNQNRFQFAMRNNKGLTLVEILIALVITLIVFLGLMQTALLSIDVNTTNLLREEAISIAEERMRELRDLSFASLTPGAWTIEPVTRDFRNFPVNYTRTVTVTDIGTGTDAKQINVLVTWEWKEKTVASGNPYTHSITTIKRG